MTEPNDLIYMRARYYDRKTGRFISEDPIGFEGGLNLYAYVSGNPVGFVDPSGLGGESDRALRITKMRRTDHYRGPIPMEITNQGIKLTKPF